MRKTQPHAWTSPELGSWAAKAACADPSIDPEIFFPASRTPIATLRARQICSTCPVVQQCGRWAIATKVEGVWGGLTETDRNNIRDRALTPADNGAHLHRMAASKQSNTADSPRRISTTGTERTG